MQEKENESNFIRTIKFTILNDLKKRKDQMSIILSKASALDPRYHELEFLSDDQKTSVWEQLENKFKEYEVIPITEINSDEDEPVEPPAKNYDLLIADSDEEEEDEGN